MDQGQSRFLCITRTLRLATAAGEDACGPTADYDNAARPQRAGPYNVQTTFVELGLLTYSTDVNACAEYNRQQEEDRDQHHERSPDLLQHFSSLFILGMRIRRVLTLRVGAVRGARCLSNLDETGNGMQQNSTSALLQHSCKQRRPSSRTQLDARQLCLSADRHPAQ